MANTFEDERREIEKRLAANFTALPIEFDNTRSSRPDTGYAAAHILPGDARFASLGGGLRRYTGVLIVQIFTPEGTGTKAALGHAETIRAAFDNVVLSLDAGGCIRFRAASLVRVGQADGFHQINVSVPFQRDSN